jgi:hypothetical protein
MRDKYEVPEIGNGFRVVLPNSVPPATLNEAEVVTEDWLRDQGGFSFAAPPGQSKIWSLHLQWYEGVKKLLPRDLSTREGRELLLKSAKEFLLAVTSAGNVGADGERTDGAIREPHSWQADPEIDREQDTSEPRLLWRIRMARRKVRSRL